MSGGHFHHAQHRITDIEDSILEVIENNKINEYYNYSDETISEFTTALKYLAIAKLYTHRIDWLLSGDDGEETFHERLKEDLKNC
jgi:hypothetical protein